MIRPAYRPKMFKYMQEVAQEVLMVNGDIEQQRAAAKAELHNLVARGLVQPAFLFPAMFGGTDDPRNVIWLTPACIREKEQFDAKVRDAVERGEIVEYVATPSYNGPGMVPARVTLTAWGSNLNMSSVIEVEPHKTW